MKVKQVCSEVDVRTGGKDLPLLSVSMHLGVVPRAQLADRVTRAEDVSGYKRCLPGDIVLNRMSAFEGAVGISSLAGLVTPEYMVLRAAGDNEPRFIHYLIKSSWFVAQMTLRLRGIGAPDQSNVRTPRIYWGDLGAIQVRMPPPEEQLAIAGFLDRETARIDALISRKRSMQGLLVARRSGVVDAALNTAQKRGWVSTRLKFLVGRATSGNREHSFTLEEAGVPCLRGVNVKPGKIDRNDLERMSLADHARHAATRLHAGDVVVVRSGNAGIAAVVPPELEGSNCVDLIIVRRSKRVLPKLVEYVINSAEARRQIEQGRAAAALGHFNAEDVGELVVGIPSAVAEQRDLLDRLENETTQLDILAVKLDRQIRLLAEHRQALITAAVTGQIDASARVA